LPGAGISNLRNRDAVDSHVQLTVASADATSIHAPRDGKRVEAIDRLDPFE